MQKPILILRTIEDLRNWRSAVPVDKQISFVPTMGSLHEGHTSLFKEASQQADIVIGSIFVNPSQFAPHEDLDQYPRCLESDLQTIQAHQLQTQTEIHALFVPSVSTMYPNGITTEVSQQVGTFVNVEQKSKILEGIQRPHFFRGVCTIVLKLLNLIQPDVLVLGQKDLQQCLIIQTMINDLFIKTRLVIAPTVRHKSNQLALSSRNQYLSNVQLDMASSLAKGLIKAQQFYHTANKTCSCADLTKIVRQSIRDADPDAKKISIEYVQVTDSELNVVKDQLLHHPNVICYFLYGCIVIDRVRLIDNIAL